MSSDENKINEQNDAVEAALYKTALGYHYYEEDYAPLKDENGNIVLESDGTPKLVVVKKKKKFQPAGVMAQRMWLQTKNPDIWGENSNKDTNNALEKVLNTLNDSIQNWNDEEEEKEDELS